MDTKTTPRKCVYCGKAIRKNQRPFVKRQPEGDWIGHKSCYLEMMTPDYTASRRDIGISR